MEWGRKKEEGCLEREEREEGEEREGKREENYQEAMGNCSLLCSLCVMVKWSFLSAVNISQLVKTSTPVLLMRYMSSTPPTQ